MSLESMDLTSPIGLIAGNGQLPLEFAKSAKALGLEVVAVLHYGEARKELCEYCPRHTWIKVGELSKLIKFFNANGVRQVAFAGGIKRPRLFRGELKLDAKALKVLSSALSVRDDSLLRAVTKELERSGLRIFSATRILSKICPAAGLISKRDLTPSERKDAALGWSIAKQLGALDVGQSVCVKDGQVLAVEALEGTDATVRRAGEIGQGAGVIIKTAKPQQDLRLDLPTIGLATIQTALEAKATALVIEAGKTIMLDAGAIIDLANQNGIAIVAMDAESISQMKLP